MIWRGLLVSVRNATEAAAALDGGAAIIDIKEPAAGSLGAATPDVIASIAAAVAGRAPLTVAAGELRDEMSNPGRTLRWFTAIKEHLGAAGGPVSAVPAAVKLGLAGMTAHRPTDWKDAFHETMRGMSAETATVAVAYADWMRVAAPDPRDVVAAGAEAGCDVFLIDTADKSHASLLRACDHDDLARWIAAGRAAGMAVAIAGRLAIDELPLVRPFAPDVVALRSAVCFNDRSGPVDVSLVRRAAAEVGLLEKVPRAATRDSSAPFAGA
ncbi:MAG: (5-formylfuran-3-yl)methyl phosphate synthase [Planctomycetia bacterium]